MKNRSKKSSSLRQHISSPLVGEEKGGGIKKNKTPIFAFPHKGGRKKLILSRHNKLGFVSLVGAGPGDPKLLTLRGKEALERADYVIYDHLVHPAILKHAPNAKHIYVGKKGGDPNSTPQESIESLMLKLVNKGMRIVRLKGGDPFIFGRGGEEALYLAEHKIPFEIVPGITAGIAVPAYAGIPVTHRTLAAEVTFITGHEDPLKEGKDINWKAIAELKGTIVLFMGVKTLPEITEVLIRYGKSPDTPVSVIRWGTTAEQQVVTGTLETISEQVEAAKLTPPALTVIGGVNHLRNKLKWFEEKPLFGKTVLITRSRKQASQLGEQLESLGARVLELPTIEISPIEKNPRLNQALKKLIDYDWIVFTSENGVEVFFERLKQLKGDGRILSRLKIAAIGPGTKAKLNSYFIEPDLVPKIFTTEGLISALKKLKISNKRFLLLRTNIAPQLLNHSLEKLGAKVTEIPIYKTERPKDLSKKATDLVHNNVIDYITFTSSSTADNFFNALKDLNGNTPSPSPLPLKGGEDKGEGVAKILSIGPVTSKTIREHGFKVDREAKESTIPGLVEALLKEATK